MGFKAIDKKDGLEFAVKGYDKEFDEYTVDIYYWPSEVLYKRDEVKSGDYIRELKRGI